ncbi:MAG: hypothetical protein KA981_13170 [Bacteroidia bacterium]|nr:hypothetical protein [Bacteroidia bacterium]
MKPKKSAYKWLIFGLWVIPFFGLTQSQANRELKLALNEDGSNYLKANFTAQIWARYIENNPGSTLFGNQKNTSYDIGLRRVRAQFYGKVHPKIFLYTQLGINNQNANNTRKPGIFFHDVLGEFEVTPKGLQIGMGLSAWTGFGRFSAPAVASILGSDAPLYQQSTNDVTDQFLRKFSIYAKGKLGKLDYRLAFTQPMSVQTAPANSIQAFGLHSTFSTKAPKLQTSAYAMWQFLDKESNTTPYMAGTYLGKKKIFNVGVGYQYQAKAMWRQGDTIFKAPYIIEEDLFNYQIDFFYDAPVGKKGSALSAYLALTQMGFGKHYLRNAAVMNPVDASSLTSLNGGGNGVPLYGTGQVWYFQTGYLLPPNLFGKRDIFLQPYFQYINAQYDALSSPMNLFDLGVNYFLDGQKSKLSFNFQNRPNYQIKDGKMNSRKNTFLIQFQIAI